MISEIYRDFIVLKHKANINTIVMFTKNKVNIFFCMVDDFYRFLWCNGWKIINPSCTTRKYHCKPIFSKVEVMMILILFTIRGIVDLNISIWMKFPNIFVICSLKWFPITILVKLEKESAISWVLFIQKVFMEKRAEISFINSAPEPWRKNQWNQIKGIQRYSPTREILHGLDLYV